MPDVQSPQVRQTPLGLRSADRAAPMSKPAHYARGPVYTPSAADARELQAEHELFDALQEGLRCAELAAKKIGHRRGNPRWMQIGFLVGNVREMAKRLGRNREGPPLLDANGMRMN